MDRSSDVPNDGSNPSRKAAGRMLTRRAVVGAAAAAAASGAVGLWVGFRLGRRGALPPAEDGALRPNAWIQVAPSGQVTIWVAKSEMGQGVHTALAQIAADQLACRWEDVGVRQAPTDLSRFGWQGTFSSTSVRESWDNLARAGAAVREMLEHTAAEVFDARPEDCRAEAGAIVHVSTGRRIPYGSLAAAAALRAAPSAPTVLAPGARPPGPETATGRAGELIGTSPARADLAAKIDGSARFGADVRWAGMCFAAIARCPHVGPLYTHPFTRGRVRTSDRAAALAVPGVREVIDVPSGVAVVAESTWAALRGRDALAVQWDDSDRPDGANGGHVGFAARLAELARDAAAPDVPAEASGDVDLAFKSAAAVHRAEYTLPFLAHATLEPMNASARRVAGRLEIWAPVQNPHGAASAAARAADVPESRVDVHVSYLGGGFGRRAENDFVEEAADLAARLDRPVQVIWDRTDDLRFDFHRPGAHHVLEAALGTDGYPVAWRHRFATQSIVAQRVPLDRPVDPTAAEGAIDLPYALGARRVLWVPAELPVRVGFWRSVGHSHNAFAVESFVDELAAHAGLDSFAYRQELLRDRPRERALLEAVALRAGWSDSPPAGVGRGIAFHTSFGSHVALVVEARLENGRPRVRRIVAGVDCGRVVHPDLVRAQIEGGVIFGLSAALGERVEFEAGAVASADLASYRLLRIPDAPAVDVLIAPSGDAPGGIGEVAVPPVAPALAAALAALDGMRRRSLPLAAS